ncbi:hypothetical protein BJ508DRAFT_313477 [Ascobolus immersus RN42]|uniref:Uncharacterized protein n=1 Tax=Ascobolus immersus RN42 TaxID=1160509 RepID=A0A3N4HMM4_ASCIM|nr:hypothetical protein BJ508DRAFT_313477 [Ascobolus immersus RN42]
MGAFSFLTLLALLLVHVSYYASWLVSGYQFRLNPYITDHPFVREDGKDYSQYTLEELLAITYPTNTFFNARLRDEVSSEFNDYYTWLLTDWCHDPMFKPFCPELPRHRDRLRTPECEQFELFYSYAGSQTYLYDDFLARNCTFENPDRWAGLPQEYLDWRRAKFTDPRVCEVGTSFRNLTSSQLFHKFGYLDPKEELQVDAMAERAKCEHITWVDDSSPVHLAPARFDYWPIQIRNLPCLINAASSYHL